MISRLKINVVVLAVAALHAINHQPQASDDLERSEDYFERLYTRIYGAGKPNFVYTRRDGRESVFTRNIRKKNTAAAKILAQFEEGPGKLVRSIGEAVSEVETSAHSPFSAKITPQEESAKVQAAAHKRLEKRKKRQAQAAARKRQAERERQEERKKQQAQAAARKQLEERKKRQAQAAARKRREERKKRQAQAAARKRREELEKQQAQAAARKRREEREKPEEKNETQEGTTARTTDLDAILQLPHNWKAREIAERLRQQRDNGKKKKVKKDNEEKNSQDFAGSDSPQQLLQRSNVKIQGLSLEEWQKREAEKKVANNLQRQKKNNRSHGETATQPKKDTDESQFTPDELPLLEWDPEKKPLPGQPDPLRTNNQQPPGYSSINIDGVLFEKSEGPQAEEAVSGNLQAEKKVVDNSIALDSANTTLTLSPQQEINSEIVEALKKIRKVENKIVNQYTVRLSQDDS
ncbi:MAG: hypothetical protein ABFQ95_04400 [Pseudomonadota bacterium]